VLRRALLVFAEEIHVDLARRGFPKKAGTLLRGTAMPHTLGGGIDVHFHTSARQSGAGFRARFENAIEEVARLGYDEIVAVGRDCPALSAADVEQAFAELAARKLVLGPDHRGGCYLIAFRARERALLRNVRWKRNTDCRQLQDRCVPGAVFLLPVKQDLDSWADVGVLARSDELLASVARFVIAVAGLAGASIRYFVSSAWRATRVRQQMPPPAFAA
jgi:hypothetical protein